MKNNLSKEKMRLLEFADIVLIELKRNQNQFLNIDIWLNRLHKVDLKDNIILDIADILISNQLCESKKDSKRSLKLKGKGIEFIEKYGSLSNYLLTKNSWTNRLKRMPLVEKVKITTTILIAVCELILKIINYSRA